LKGGGAPSLEDGHLIHTDGFLVEHADLVFLKRRGS
jgi:hypothetical protein